MLESRLSGILNLESGIWNLGSGILDLESLIWNFESLMLRTIVCNLAHRQQLVQFAARSEENDSRA